MAIRTVPASKGIEWLAQSVQLILRNPAPFLLMGLVVAVAGALPILGSLALVILGPTLNAGIAYAGRELHDGGIPDFKHLFEAFKDQNKLVKLLIMCLPGVAGGFLVALMLVGVMLMAMAGAGVSVAVDSSTALIASLGVGGLILCLVLIMIALAVFALTFFATPEVMFGRSEAISAMKESFSASLANLGAVLLFLVSLFLVALAIGLLFVMLSQVLAQVVVSMLLTPVAAVSMYLAWKDVVAPLHTSEIPAITDDTPPPGGFAA
jgi:uncharacterized membrane protein